VSRPQRVNCADQSRSRKIFDRTLAILSIALALPPAVVAILILAGAISPNAPASWPYSFSLKWLAVLGIAGVGLFLTRIFSRTGLLWRPLGCLARFRLEPVDRPVGEKVSHYSELISLHIPMLQMTPRELAQRAGLFRWEAEFIVRHPSFVPRSDAESRIRGALMVPQDWPRNGYGSECTKQRLLWYSSKGQCVWTAQHIEAATANSRAAVLRVLEAELQNALSVPQKEGSRR
jgi:hypothetical protein